MNENPMPVPFVDLKAQHRPLRKEIDAAVARVIDDCSFILGGAVTSFEESFASFVGTRHAIGVADGLDALRLSLSALGVGPGDEVVVPANTFIATALAVSQAGASIRLVDCDPETYEIDARRIEDALTPRTRVILPVHLTGMAADLDPILAIAERRGLQVVEDAAQAHGARYKGRRCGSFGRAGCFSFYPGKNLGACGDGGAVTTNDADLAARLRKLRNYGQEVKYVHVEKGVNSRLDSIQAAILGVKLRHLEDWNAARHRHAQAYREQLAGVGDLVFQREDPNSTHVHHLFIVQTGLREALQAHLRSAGIETGIHYPIPIHRQKAYADLGYGEGAFPVAERLAGRILSLPMFAELTPAQVEHVCLQVRRFFRDHGR